MRFHSSHGIVVLAVLVWGLTAQGQTSQPQIAGHVVRSDNGAPIEGTSVVLLPPIIHGNAQFQTAKSDSYGEYRFAGVGAGTYSIRASANGFVPKDYSRDGTLEGEFQVMGTETSLRGVDFQLQPEAVIRGLLTNAASQPADARISVAAVHRERGPDGSDRLLTVTQTKTDSGGRFALKELPPGNYFVCVNGPNGSAEPEPAGGWYRETWYGNTSTADGATLVPLREGEERDNVRITVERERRYRIVIWPAGPEGEPKPERYDVHLEGRNHTSIEQSDGSYLIPDVPAGHYKLESTAWSGVQYEGAGELSFDVSAKDVTLHVQVGGLGEISGVAKMDDSAGKAAAGVMIALTSPVAAQASSTDAQGRFLFKRVLPGSYALRLAGDPTGIDLRSVRCSGAFITPEIPLRVGDREQIADCEILLGRKRQ